MRKSKTPHAIAVIGEKKAGAKTTTGMKEGDPAVATEDRKVKRPKKGGMGRAKKIGGEFLYNKVHAW